MFAQLKKKGVGIEFKSVEVSFILSILRTSLILCIWQHQILLVVVARAYRGKIIALSRGVVRQILSDTYFWVQLDLGIPCFRPPGSTTRPTGRKRQLRIVDQRQTRESRSIQSCGGPSRKYCLSTTTDIFCSIYTYSISQLHPTGIFGLNSCSFSFSSRIVSATHCRCLSFFVFFLLDWNSLRISSRMKVQVHRNWSVDKGNIYKYMNYYKHTFCKLLRERKARDNK